MTINFLIFLGASSLVASYVFIIHRWLGKAEQGEHPGGHLAATRLPSSIR